MRINASSIWILRLRYMARNNPFFKGQSLFDSITNQRLISCLSTNDTRHYSAEGFGFYQRDESFLYHDHSGFHYYRLKDDPNQLRDLIDSLSPDKRAYYDSIVHSNGYFEAILERHEE